MKFENIIKGDFLKPPDLFTLPQCELKIGDGFCIKIMRKMPNRWWRFWQWVFFGFKWKNLENVERIF